MQYNFNRTIHLLNKRQPAKPQTLKPVSCSHEVFSRFPSNVDATSHTRSLTPGNDINPGKGEIFVKNCGWHIGQERHPGQNICDTSNYLTITRPTLFFGEGGGGSGDGRSKLFWSHSKKATEIVLTLEST